MYGSRRGSLAVIFALSLLVFWCGPCRADADITPAKLYVDVAKSLEALIAHEMEDKDLPALSIALVDDQGIVWAKGFGFADPKTKKPATAETVYRVGSVSKLFTDLAVMQLVEKGALDLDAPITKVLPDFKPLNKYDKQITLRQLMSHRSGLCREPPVGHYFDPDTPSLAKTVQSLNRTELVFEPEARVKYSNAAIATVGFVLEETQKQAFPRYLGRTILDPLGMKHSTFEPDPTITKDLAKGVMWSYQGREFPAPTFELGEAPAGCLYTTVTDLGRFMSVLFARGKGPNGVIVKPETLAEMWKPQFAKPDDKGRKFGLGFIIGEVDGKRRMGHSGAIYGFATELEFLPDEKLGVVVVTSRDISNGVTNHIADVALKQMLAAKAGKPLPKIEYPTKLKPELARKLAGRWSVKGEKAIDLTESNGKLWVVPVKGGERVELRTLGDNTLVMDDRLGYGVKIEIKGDKLVADKDEYERETMKKPEPAPAKWLGLLGEYGWDHDILYIYEKDGKLHCYIEWEGLYPLTEEAPNVFKFPDLGLYPGEKLIFTRDKNGRATQVEAANVVFERRKVDGENGETFKIMPQHPLDELRKEALAAKPPVEKGDFRKPELVELVKLDDTIKLDIRYATDNNFLSTPFYKSAKAFMQKPAAEALMRVNKKLAKDGYGVLVFDGYRPWSVTKMFWEATPEKFRMFVADPAKGSRHNRGCAVDLTLYDLKTGKPVTMTGGYDEMSDRSYPEYVAGTSLQRWHRDLLRHTMESEGFTVYEAEWWHFDYKDWKQYPIQNETFEQLEAK